MAISLPRVSSRQELQLQHFVARKRNLLVLTGAGCSTESGLPDYRDANGTWKHSKPIQHQDFVGSEASRRRYWARSMVGWTNFGYSKPNPAHVALAGMESTGHVGQIITQNVDRLHQQAGSRHVIDLHGRLDQVVCLNCDQIQPRESVQQWLNNNNPAWVDHDAMSAPDGDAQLEGQFDSFQTPVCGDCNGILKPNVVFFGDGVPRTRVELGFEAVANADGLLIVGSSLMVFSGFRFVRKAHELGIPIAAINHGITRADDLFHLKIEASCGPTLENLAREIKPN